MNPWKLHFSMERNLNLFVHGGKVISTIDKVEARSGSGEKGPGGQSELEEDVLCPQNHLQRQDHHGTGIHYSGGDRKGNEER